MGKLTDLQIRQWVKAGQPIAGKSDGDGLTFTLSKGGTAAWVLRYRFAGRQRELSLGRYPDVGLKLAREKAAEARVAVNSGADVALVKRRTKLALKEVDTFSALAADYMTYAAPSLSSTTQKETRRYLRKDINPRIGRLRVNEVTGGEIVHLIKAVARRSQSVARRAFEILSVVFAHGVAKQIVLLNPCDALKVSAIIGVRPKRSERIKLTHEEIRALLAALPSLGAANALAIKVLLATCVRKGELIRARWEHVDLAKGVWVIPDEHAKGGKGFEIPLAAAVVRWFAELKTYSGDSAYVLPSRKQGRASTTQPICRSTLNAAINRLDCNVRCFSPHDLRSTARSYLAELGVDIIIAERCLNHSLGGLVAVYDQHDYMDERRVALSLWADFIESAEQVKQSNVVSIQKIAQSG